MAFSIDAIFFNPKINRYIHTVSALNVVFLILTDRIHGICVCDNANYFYSIANGYLKEMGLTADGQTTVDSKQIMDIVDGYKGNGYAESTDEELSMLTIVQ